MDSDKLKEYVYGNLVSIFWSGFLLFGGAIFVYYYANIGYMPDFDLKSSVTLLAAASITAIIIVILFIIILILPGLFWSNTWANESPIKSNWEDEDGHKILYKTALWFGLPILSLYGFLAILTLSWLISIPYFICVTIISYLIVCKRSTLSKKQSLEETSKMIFSSFVCALLAFIPIFFVLSVSVSNLSTSKGSPALIGPIVVGFIVLTNILVTAKPKGIKGAIYYPALGAIAFYVVFSSFELFYRIPERVMEIYKFGSIDTESIILNNEGCNTVLTLGLISKVTPEKQCVLINAKILSRLGKDMYLEIDHTRFTLKNSEILSWSVKESYKKLHNQSED
ncbi:hypothetical protein Q7C15_21700 [Aeromonas salmonicida]|uniref:hypothetical protein n=1 Tax=Aeromonas salmonicida TaxID=645 RepID=UPI0035BFAB99